MNKLLTFFLEQTALTCLWQEGIKATVFANKITIDTMSKQKQTTVWFSFIFLCPITESS